MNTEQTSVSLSQFLNFYRGYLIDEPSSSFASGSIIDGVFYGTITSAKLGKFFIEPSRRYNHSLDAHSIIYNEKDVDLDRAKLKQFKRSIEDSKFKQSNDNSQVGCASDKKKVKDWMKHEQEALYNQRIKDKVIYIFFFLNFKKDKFIKKKLAIRYIIKNVFKLKF